MWAFGVNSAAKGVGSIPLRPAADPTAASPGPAKPASSAAAIRAAVIAQRKQLVYPADPKVAAGLASRYKSEDLGSMAFTRSASGLSGNNGVWSVNFATKVNPDGTVSLVTASPGLSGLEFVVANDGGKRALVVRDGQHVYRYIETQ